MDKSIKNMTKAEMMELIEQLQAQLSKDDKAVKEKSKSTKVEPKATKKKVIEELPTIEPTRRVEITSMCEGTLTIATYSDIYHLPYKGSTEIVTFEELRKLKNSNRGYFEKMLFKIEDMEVVKALKLDKFYGSSLEMAEDPISYFSNSKLTEEQALADYKLLPQSQRMNIIEVLIKAWAVGEFVDYSVRNFFKKYCDNIDLEEEAESLVESRVDLNIE
ncbi:hypothetical protein ACQPV1_08685 [Clostridium neonatale]|uniref:hypothetical protein n=1 Tax=Clostridium neonatale TaxID=137838 RepID=UPI003D3489CA